VDFPGILELHSDGGAVRTTGYFHHFTTPVPWMTYTHADFKRMSLCGVVGDVGLWLLPLEGQLCTGHQQWTFPVLLSGFKSLSRLLQALVTRRR
jgi:hypothetical protein